MTWCSLCSIDLYWSMLLPFIVLIQVFIARNCCLLYDWNYFCSICFILFLRNVNSFILDFLCFSSISSTLSVSFVCLCGFFCLFFVFCFFHFILGDVVKLAAICITVLSVTFILSVLFFLLFVLVHCPSSSLAFSFFSESFYFFFEIFLSGYNFCYGQFLWDSIEKLTCTFSLIL